VEKYPGHHVRSNDGRAEGRPTTYVLHGASTIRDVTRPVSVEFEQTGAVVDPWGNFRIGFEGKTTVNRKDWA